MTGYSRQYGEQMTKEDKKQDIIKGIRKYLEIGAFEQVMLREKELISEYGMTEEEIEIAIYS